MTALKGELTRVPITGSSSSKQDIKVQVGIGSEGHDFTGDFSIISHTTFEVTSVNFANEQLEDCIMSSASVVAG